MAGLFPDAIEEKQFFGLALMNWMASFVKFSVRRLLLNGSERVRMTSHSHSLARTTLRT